MKNHTDVLLVSLPEQVQAQIWDLRRLRRESAQKWG